MSYETFYTWLWRLIGAGFVALIAAFLLGFLSELARYVG